MLLTISLTSYPHWATSLKSCLTQADIPPHKTALLRSESQIITTLKKSIKLIMSEIPYPFSKQQNIFSMFWGIIKQDKKKKKTLRSIVNKVCLEDCPQYVTRVKISEILYWNSSLLLRAYRLILSFFMYLSLHIRKPWRYPLMTHSRMQDLITIN